MIVKLTPSQMHNVSGEGFVFFTVSILRTCLSTLLFLVLLKKGKKYPIDLATLYNHGYMRPDKGISIFGLYDYHNVFIAIL